MTATPQGCSTRPPLPVRSRQVSVNGVAIPRAAIARETQHHPAAQPLQAMQAAARALAIRELLLQEARRLGITATPLVDGDGRRETDEDAAIRQLVEREVRVPVADEATCRRYHQLNPLRFRTPDLFAVRHILLPAAPADPSAMTAARATAQTILAALATDPGAFALLAAAHSACPSARLGGSLGQIGPGQTVPEFEAALPSLAIGAPALVETRYGLHVVRVDRCVRGVALPFEAVGARIAAWLTETVRRTAIRQYIALLAGRAEIVGVALVGETSPPLVR